MSTITLITSRQVKVCLFFNCEKKNHKTESNAIVRFLYPKEVKKAMWFDMITNKLFWIVLVLIFVIVVPKATLLPLLWAWLKKQLPLLIHFGVVGVSLLILSG
jgi:hypothetical protein